MTIKWDDIKLFLDVARMGGLSAAGRVTGLSPATLGRRITALEQALGEPLFTRSRTGYHLTSAGQDLLQRAAEIEHGFANIERWRDSRLGDRVVRISAGHWTASFLARNMGALWTPEDDFHIELVTGNQKVDIGHRHADLGVRNVRPTERWLAGRLVGHNVFALYSGRKMINGVKVGMFVGHTGAALTPSSRWLEAHHGDRIGVRGNDSANVRELVAAGAGFSVFPCFVADIDPRLVRIASVIDDLTAEQWLVTHHDERHDRFVRRVGDRVAALISAHKALMLGQKPIA